MLSNCIHNLLCTNTNIYHPISPARAFLGYVNKPEFHRIQIELMCNFINHVFSSKNCNCRAWSTVCRSLWFIIYNVIRLNSYIINAIWCKNSCCCSSQRCSRICTCLVKTVGFSCNNTS